MTNETLTPAVFSLLLKFINQRSGIDPRNYFSTWSDREGRRAFESERRSISKDGSRARLFQ